jgi:hypothetical protein
MSEETYGGIYVDRFGGVRPPGKRLAYAAARTAWIKAEGKGDEARLLFERDPRIRDLDPQVIMLLLAIALLLFAFWLQQEIDEPSVVPSGLEPIDWDEANSAD